MSYLSEMEWNAKWDWENYVPFGLKAIESPKKLQLAEWMIDDEGYIDPTSFNLSGGSGNSGVSCSDGGHGSSAKSSLSASTDSSAVNGIQTPSYRFTKLEGFCGNFGKKMEMKGSEVSGTSPPMEVSVEPLIGLKLGKRTYFENSVSGGNAKSSSFYGMPIPASSAAKKTKSSGQNASIPRCQVEDCNLDLSMAKEYHQKHRVCDSHSKSPKVFVGGFERRFCQQCSRFHSLSEFDEKKRSCRRRLSDHNARRRKPQPETIQFNSTRPSSSFYGGRQQLNFLLSNDSHPDARAPANSTWDIASNSKFTITKGGGTNEILNMPGIKLSMNGDPASGLLASKNFVSDVLNPVYKGAMISSHKDAAPDFDRALSLLSSNSWGSYLPESIIRRPHPLHESDIGIPQPPTIHGNPQGMQISSSQIWLPDHQSTHRIPSLVANHHYQEIPLFKSPYDAPDDDIVYSNVLN